MMRPRHAGLDIVCKIDDYVKTGQDSVLTTAPVWAAHAGTVTIANDVDDSSAGKFISIKEPGGISTVYLHLSETKVKQGDVVKQGQIIGIQGHTGGLTIDNIHLHFEVYGKDNALLDPEVCLAGKTPPANGVAGTPSSAQGVAKIPNFGTPGIGLLVMALVFTTLAMKSGVGMGANLLNVPVLAGAGKAILGAGMGAAGFLTGIVGGAAAGKAGEAMGALPDALGNMGQAIGNNPLVQGIQQNMQDGMAAMQQAAMNNPMMQGIGQGMADAAGALQGFADTTMGRISEIQQNIAQGVAPAVQGMQDIGGRIAGAVTGAMDAAQQGLQNVQNAIPQGLRDAGGKLTDAGAAMGRLAATGATNVFVGTVNNTANLLIGSAGAVANSAVSTALDATGSREFFGGVVAGAGLYQSRQFTEAEIARSAGLQQVILDNETYIKSLRAQKEAIENANSPSYIADATRRNAMMDELRYRELRARYEIDMADTGRRDVSGHYDPREGQNWGQRISGQIGDKWDVIAHTHLGAVIDRAKNPRTLLEGSDMPQGMNAREIGSIGLAGYEERMYKHARNYTNIVESDTRSIRNTSDQKALDRAVEQYMKRNRDAIETVSGGTSLRDVTSGRWQQSVAESRQSPLTKIADSARSSFDSARSSLGNTLSNPPRKAEQDGWYEETPTQHKKDYGDYEAPKRTR